MGKEEGRVEYNDVGWRGNTKKERDMIPRGHRIPLAKDIRR